MTTRRQAGLARSSTALLQPSGDVIDLTAEGSSPHLAVAPHRRQRETTVSSSPVRVTEERRPARRRRRSASPSGTAINVDLDADLTITRPPTGVDDVTITGEAPGRRRRPSRPLATSQPNSLSPSSGLRGGWAGLLSNARGGLARYLPSSYSPNFSQSGLLFSMGHQAPVTRASARLRPGSDYEGENMSRNLGAHDFPMDLPWQSILFPHFQGIFGTTPGHLDHDNGAGASEHGLSADDIWKMQTPPPAKEGFTRKIPDLEDPAEREAAQNQILTCAKCPRPLLVSPLDETSTAEGSGVGSLPDRTHRRPWALRCGHVVCADCFDVIFDKKTSLVDRAGKGVCPAPECRKPVARPVGNSIGTRGKYQAVHLYI